MTQLRRDFKRSKLDFRIITKESDSNAKYDLFQRLNSGSVLSPQEARNCLMVMINREYYGQIIGMAASKKFNDCIPLTDRQKSEAYREELVLRFFCQNQFNEPPKELKKEYGDFLTDWMRGAAESDNEPEVELFDRTFDLLHAAKGEDVFRKLSGNRHLGPFSISAYEFITTGVAANIDDWERLGVDDLRDRIDNVWNSEAFRSNSGTGVSPRRRVPRIIHSSREFFGAT